MFCSLLEQSRHLERLCSTARQEFIFLVPVLGMGVLSLLLFQRLFFLWGLLTKSFEVSNIIPKTMDCDISRPSRVRDQMQGMASVLQNVGGFRDQLMHHLHGRTRVRNRCNLLTIVDPTHVIHSTIPTEAMAEAMDRRGQPFVRQHS